VILPAGNVVAVWTGVASGVFDMVLNAEYISYYAVLLFKYLLHPADRVVSGHPCLGTTVSESLPGVHPTLTRLVPGKNREDVLCRIVPFCVCTEY
jgi:hypothetical protein